MSFEGMDIVSIRDLSREQIEEVMERSERMIPYARGEKASKALDGKILATLFFEPSTRTRMSFESAMMRLGGRITDLGVPSMSSISKGESLADTIRMVEVYSDIIVIRHPREGAARLAARFSSKPVINAGDGAGQHPTQTLLDLFTIKRIKKDFNKLNVVMVGDLKYGRTVHSLAEALSSFGVELTFVAPAALQMPKETVRQVERMGGRPKLTNRLEETIADADVLYVTRIQKERFPDLAEYQKVAGMYRVDRRLLREAKSDLIVLHPLPRVDEIDPEVDGTPHAKYFEQAFNGVPVRMALLNLVLGGEL
ncbi:MAG: aspartate carbamoyltransferase [Euryarchaeota archaeon]|jgi:aspartate carbamoyltransferase catalytic subunit|nr:aspartate carbamoyltransferase [Euryarchaeota archaeon]HQM67445.1 aspartate carbamoyltransferase [Methanomassiliicoccales archaeon]